MRTRFLAAASLMLVLCTAATVASAAVASGSAFSGGAAAPAFVPAQYSAFNSYSVFGFAMPGPAGDIFAQGYSLDRMAPDLLAGNFIINGDNHYLARDLEIVDRLTPDIDLELGYNVGWAGRFGAYDDVSNSAFAGLFSGASAIGSPYAALTNGGNYVGSRVALSDGMSMRFGEATLDPFVSNYGMPAFSFDAPVWSSRLQLDPRQVQTSLAGVDWNFASWGGLGMVATQTTEHNGVLGSYGSSNALSVAKTASTTAVGVSARVGFGDGWVTTFSYNQGITQLSLRPNAFSAGSADTLQSRSYGFAVAKHGLFGDDDSLGFAVSRPLQVYSGTDFNVTDGFGAPDSLIGHGIPSLSSTAPETDLELGYVTTFMNGALALQANAGYQMNATGLGGSNSLSVISRAKINF